MAWVGSPKMGTALPWGQGRGEPGGAGRGGSAEVRGNAGLPGHFAKGFPQSGNEPWGGAFRESVSAPQHASDLINPLGKDRASGWRADCGELKKLTCAAIKRAAALSDSPRATEIAPEAAAGGPGSSLPSQEKGTKRGDGLGGGPALQTLQSLETKAPLQASTSRTDKGSEEIRRPMERGVAVGLLQWALWAEGTMAQFPFQMQDTLEKTIFWFRSKLTSQSREASYWKTPAEPWFLNVRRLKIQFMTPYTNFSTFFEVTSA